ncbi:MAG: hypothetical protein IJM30_09810 [Thermoguttaceae bacterium]|nr:hypothetical protein [Thermoguttaceae bacterium]
MIFTPGRLTRRRARAIFRTTSALRRDPKYSGKSRRAIAELALAKSSPWLVRAARHFALVVRHKWWALVYCAYAGIPWRGFAHDWSKFSPSEFFESVKYFNGRRSPVGLCRELEGYSFAWLHHKGRNKHHFEFWIDVVSPDGLPSPVYGQWFALPMPFEYALESICDTIAASRAYNGRRFGPEVLYRWWKRRQERPVNMHPATKRFADEMYETIRAEGNFSVLRRARAIYDRAQREASESPVDFRFSASYNDNSVGDR